MFSFGQALNLIGLALEACVLLLMWRRGLLSRFRFFATYVAYVFVHTLVCYLFASSTYYFYIYWSTEPAAFLLKILAVYESFMQVFRSYYLLRWFKILLPGTAALALGISGARAYLHPAHGSPTAEAIIGSEVTAQYIVLTICILFFLLVGLFRVPWRIHEYRIMLGFGLSALAISFAGSVRSEFGTRFEDLSKILPGVAYLLALVIWLTAVNHSLPKTHDLSDGELGPNTWVQEARRQLLVIRSLLHRGQ